MINKMYEKIEFFKNNFPSYFYAMNSSNHATLDINNNPYHIEGSVWSHTMAVCSHLQESSDILQWAGLLHDVAKPDCRLVDPDTQKVSFRNHGSVGAFKCIEILRAAGVPSEDIKIIVRLIAKHQDLYLTGVKNTMLINNIDEVNFYDQLKELTRADSMGAISKELHSDSYSNNIVPSFTPQDSTNKKHLVLMVGLPASGKSTIAMRDYPAYTKISRDDLVVSKARNIDKTLNTYHECWKYCDDNNLQGAIDKQLQRDFQAAYQSKENIVVDMTNMSAKSRRKWTHSVNNYYITAHIVMIDIPTTIIRNNTRKGKHIPSYVIDTMMKAFVYPDYSQVDEILFTLN